MKTLFANLFLLSLAVSAAESTIAERLDVSGDFRTRYELTDYDDETRDRQRLRIRFRLQATWKIDQHWTVGVRGATGNPDDPRSSNQTLDGGFEKFDFSLDRAYVRFKKAGATAWFGKFAHPFKNFQAYPGMIWDGDIQPEGMAGKWEGDYFFTAASFYLLDEKSSDSDLRMLAGQVGGQSSGTIGSSWSVAYYDYSDLEGEVLNGDLMGPVQMIDAQTAISFPMGAFTGSCSIQYLYNADAPDSEDTGLVAGFMLKSKGRLKRAFFQVHDLEEHAVLPYTAQDDFIYDHFFEGWTAACDIGLWKNIQSRLWVLSSKSGVPGSSTIMRYRVDLNLRF